MALKIHIIKTTQAHSAPGSNIMLNFEIIAERRIQQAMKDGAFDNLQGKGKPLVFEDDSMIPPDLRMAYKILKNAGFIPPAIQNEREIQHALDMLDQMNDERERYAQVTKLNLMITKGNMMRQRPIYLEADQVYYRKVVEKVKLNSKRGKS